MTSTDHQTRNLNIFNRPPKIALRATHIKLAQHFAESAQNNQQRDSIYHNTLAILAISDWLTWLDIPHTHHGCDSWDSTARWFDDVADLTLYGLGRIECRPILPGDSVMKIPVESQGARTGYWAIGLDLAGDCAMLLGFLPAEWVGDRDQVSLDELEDVGAFLHWCRDQQLRVDVNLADAIQLGDWLVEKFDHGWQKLSTLLNELVDPTELSLNYRRNTGMTGARVVEMGGDRIQAILSVAMNLAESEEIESEETESEETESEEYEWDITIRLQHRNPDLMLPNDLKLAVFDVVGRETIVVYPTDHTNLQVSFTAEPGEGFQVQLSWEGQTLAETLVAPIA
ncbi:MAG: DUF1822 family protein [Oscillatoriales cyanobacterium]|nr:MAG: DUF1822 family protein [Oscillatoriales cyanobacterium]